MSLAAHSLCYPVSKSECHFFTGFGVAFTSGFATGFGAGAGAVFLTSTFFSIKRPPFSRRRGIEKGDFFLPSKVDYPDEKNKFFHLLLSYHIPPKIQGLKVRFRQIFDGFRKGKTGASAFVFREDGV